MKKAKFKEWFRVGSDPRWYSNHMIFDDIEAARTHAFNKFTAWTLANDWCVRTSDQDPNNEEIMDHDDVTRIIETL